MRTDFAARQDCDPVESLPLKSTPSEGNCWNYYNNPENLNPLPGFIINK